MDFSIFGPPSISIDHWEAKKGPGCPVVVNFAVFGWSDTVPTDPYWGTQTCALVNHLSAAFEIRLTIIISRVSLIAADLIVIAVTWSPTYTAAARTVRAGFGHRRITLPRRFMFRDGLIYFIVMVTMVGLHLAFSTTGSVLMAADHVSEITEFTEPLTAILVWRFMLNLQKAGPKDGLRTEFEFGSMLSGDRNNSSFHFDTTVGRPEGR